ncbi:MAG: hypothetical protein HYY18_04940, partial [Planctomycetes bacterium]|nr:hypothetical protein [Planctomycetota bacterium]
MKKAVAGAPHALLLEAGDSLVDNDARRKGALRDQTVKKAEVIADFFKAVPPDAVSIGETEFTLGFDRSIEMLGERGFQAVTTNLRRKGETAPAYKITEAAGYRFLSLTLFGKKAAPEGVEWTDPVEAMDAARKAAGPADVTLVTFHQIDEATARKIAERGDFVKVLIDADSARRLKPTSRTTRTLVVAPPLKGTELLVLDLHLKRGAEAWYQAKRFEVLLKGGGSGEGLGTREEEG